MSDFMKIRAEIVPGDDKQPPYVLPVGTWRAIGPKQTATVEFTPASPLVDAYAGLAGMLDGIDDDAHAEAIRSAGDALWKAMSEAEKDEARVCLALIGGEPCPEK